MMNPFNPAQWPEPLQARHAQLQERYNALQPRERKLVLAAAFIVLLMLLYLLVWDPASHARQANAAALQEARSTAAQIERLAARIPQRAAKASHNAADKGSSLLTIVDSASRNIVGLPAPSRLQPEGDDEVRIWFERAPFKSLVQWAQALRSAHGISVIDADVSASDTAGVVNARFSLQGSK